jgi:hypothetical protein
VKIDSTGIFNDGRHNITASENYLQKHYTDFKKQQKYVFLKTVNNIFKERTQPTSIHPKSRHFSRATRLLGIKPSTFHSRISFSITPLMIYFMSILYFFPHITTN